MSASLLTWLRAPRVSGADVQHVVRGGFLLTRVFVERLVEDDLGDATETLDFSYRGTDYQLALSARDARALDKLLAPVLEASRRRRRRNVTRGPVAKAPNGAPSAKTVRAWAKDEGIEVSDRGRVAAGVMQRYEDAHGG